MIFKNASIFFSNSPFWSETFRSLAMALDTTTASIWYLSLYSLMILFFSYFWVATQFNEIQIADDLKKNGGYIPGVRPGTGTSDYLHKAMSRITLAGAIFLTVIAVIPIILSRKMGISYAVASFFGGTSILITVGVLLDTMRQVESHLMMRHYDGFLKKGKLRGRFCFCGRNKIKVRGRFKVDASGMCGRRKSFGRDSRVHQTGLDDETGGRVCSGSNKGAWGEERFFRLSEISVPYMSFGERRSCSRTVN
jgi:hypothetical protein